MRAMVLAVLATWTVAHAADQTIRGDQLLVKNPGTAAKRVIVGKAKETGSANTLVGDPTSAGATLTVRAEGTTPTTQTFALPQGTSAAKGKPFWSGDSVGGFKYKDPEGENGPVKGVQIKKSKGGVFSIKLKVDGKLGPVSVVPPDPGDGGCVLLAVTGGDSYSVRFTPGDGEVTNKGSVLFKIKKPMLEGTCIGATDFCGDGVTTGAEVCDPPGALACPSSSVMGSFTACQADCTCCAHDLCTIGPRLDPLCDPCVAQICAVDPYCCNVAWDTLCRGEVGSVCGSDRCNVCGDGVVAGGETCDGSAGCAPGVYCNDDCTTCDTTICGDGEVAGDETCDGVAGCTPGLYCNGACTACDTTVCGDGIVAGAEVCDGSVGCPASQTCDATCAACNACPAATSIPAGGGTFTGTTSVGGSFVLGSCGGSGFSPEQTFEWTPALSGVATIELCGSSYDTVVYIRDGGCGGAELACNDDFCGLGSTILPTVTAGQTYTIVVDGYSGDSGPFTLTVTPPSP